MIKESQCNFDAIVLGLGCMGLSATYYLSKQGFKVLGLDRSSMSGEIGSGTTGHARIWRYMHTESRFAKMMDESIKGI